MSKSIVDAVNEFKGVWPYNYDFMCETSKENPPHIFKSTEGIHVNHMHTHVCTREEFNQCVDEMSKAEWIKPVTLSPIYTQEMADNGELPLVGMECMINDSIHDDKYYKSVISFVGTSNIIWTHGGAEYSQSTSPLTFKPITPPIELIDGEFYGFDYNNDSYRGIYSKREDRFIFADGHVMAISCKNIQPLTVEVK